MTTGEPTPPPLTPGSALAWLRSLSVDVTAAAVLDDDGALLAGDAELARNLGTTAVMTAKSGRYTVVARIGPQALERLAHADLQAAADALDPH